MKHAKKSRKGCDTFEKKTSQTRREDAAESLLEETCSALAIMTHYVAENQKAAGRGVETVIAVLRREYAADSLVEQACLALAKITHGVAENIEAAR